MRNKLKQTNGITLIALVITIIVLLILAAISIATLTGENGILTKASKAKEEQADATVREAISLAWNDYQIEINAPSGEVIEHETKIASIEKVKIQGKEEEYLATSSMSFLDFLEGKGYVDENGVVNVKALTGENLSRGNGTDGATDVYKVEETTETYTLKYYENENKEKMLWEVNKSSNSTGEIDWDKIFAEAKPAEGQSESNTSIGIGPNGEPVNMDYWLSVKNAYKNGYILKGESSCSGYSSAYLHVFDENGQIVGEIPKYIKKNEDDTFLPVTSLEYTFAGCEGLKIAPEIPSSVKDMIYTFGGCTSLTTAPEIPLSVTNLSSTFYGCTKLTTAPEIPSSVTNLSSTFYGCTKLTTAPEIPSSVTDLSYTFTECKGLTTAPEIPSSVTDMRVTFGGCTSLQGELKINALPSSYFDCFYQAATSGQTLTLVGSDEALLKALQATKGTGTDSKIEYRVET